MTRPFGLVFLIIVALTLACGDDDGGSPTPTRDAGPDTGTQTTAATFKPTILGSSEFSSGQTIPVEFTCDGADTSPPLQWGSEFDRPDALALAIELEDPDAGGFVHWLVYDIPPSVTELPAALPEGEQFGNGSKQAVNSFGDAAYGGPCPPEGEEHEYIFRLYTLDAKTDLAGGTDAEEVKEALAEHTLAISELAVVYGR